MLLAVAAMLALLVNCGLPTAAAPVVSFTLLLLFPKALFTDSSMTVWPWLSATGLAIVISSLALLVTTRFLRQHSRTIGHSAAAAGRKGSTPGICELTPCPTARAGLLDDSARDEFEGQSWGEMGREWSAVPCAPLVPICLGRAREP